MEKYFTTQEGLKVNIIEHTLEQIKKWPHLKIYVGTDSQSYSRTTRYVTCVCYRYGNRGAHFIYFKEDIPRDHDRTQFTRLFGEGIRTLETAGVITDEIPVSIEAMEFDFADIVKTLSSKLVSSFKGYKNAKFKSGEMIATKAADFVCRHPEVYK